MTTPSLRRIVEWTAELPCNCNIQCLEDGSYGPVADLCLSCVAKKRLASLDDETTEDATP
jgi:hypothetical protein